MNRIVPICVNMGWDYHTYMNQPEWFIYAIEMYLKEISANQKNG